LENITFSSEEDVIFTKYFLIDLNVESNMIIIFCFVWQFYLLKWQRIAEMLITFNWHTFCPFPEANKFNKK